MFKLVYVLCTIAICYINCHRRIASQYNNVRISAKLLYNDSDINFVDESIPHRKLITSADHKIINLPGLMENLNHYSGHITIDSAKGSNIFYWLFESPNNSDKLPLLIWLNGGPGCSSMDGLWLEMGPLRLDSVTRKVKINPFSWHKVANLLFIDQPVGTGFSYTKNNKAYPSNDQMVNEQFYKFLIAFFNLHDNYISINANRKFTRDVFISGESHAGHYIPSMAMHIMEMNDILVADTSSTNGLEIKLKGIALGNPWIDPYSQYDASDYAHGKGIITIGQKNKLKEAEKICQTNLKNGKLNTGVCFSLLDKIIDSSSVSGNMKVLMYDSRKYVTHTGVFPPGHGAVENYLNRADVKASIHSTSVPHKFKECTDPPYYALSHQDGKGVLKELQIILEKGLRVLVFAGQYDIICNHLGVEKGVNRINWKYKTEWLKAQPGVWLKNKKPVGYIRAFKNLEYLLVLDAGHMVPMDQPAVSLSMIQNFIEGRSFISGLTKIGIIQNEQSAFEKKSECFCPTKDTISTSIIRNDSIQILTNRLKIHNRNHLWKKSKPKLLQSPLEQRRLDEEDETLNFPYHLSITNIIPMEDSVILYLHLQYTDPTYEKFNKLPTDLRNYHFDIRIEPGNRVVDVNIKLLEKHKYNLDIVIDGLNKKGIDYSFSVWIVDNYTKHSFLSSKRSMTTRVGCYNPLITQCCGRGTCVSSVFKSDLKFNQNAHCICDHSYSGDYCDYYQVEDPIKGISINVSAADTACPANSLILGTHLKASSTSPMDRIHSSAETHKYCQYSIETHNDVSNCCVSIEFLLYSKHINSWISGKQFNKLYKMSLSDLIKFDIINALELDDIKGNKVSITTKVGSIVPSFDDKIILNQTFSKSGSRYEHFSHREELNNLNNQSPPSLHQHNIVVLLSGESNTINRVTEELMHQRKNSHSSLLGGIVTSHIKPNHIIIVNHRFIKDKMMLGSSNTEEKTKTIQDFYGWTYEYYKFFHNYILDKFAYSIISIRFISILLIILLYFVNSIRYFYNIKIQ